MKLTQIVGALDQTGRYGDGEIATVRDDGKDPELASLAYDSRRIRPGEQGVVFACARGDHTDGHDFAAKAVSAGAAALLCERELPIDVPQVVVRNVRAFMGDFAAVLYGSPASRMKMIALTGTNGKTTTAYVTRSILRASGASVGMLGTIVYDDGATETFADRTTPEGPDIQQSLATMVRNGATHCVMETSSHGLHQGRLNGCRYARAGFSNLTPEHLEYHKDMESYFQAKRLLFTNYVDEAWMGAINADDAHGRRLLDEFASHTRGFSLDAAAIGIPYRGSGFMQHIAGMSMTLTYPDGETDTLQSPLIGAYNASNILESVVIADSLGIDRRKIAEGVRHCPQVPGRLERYAFRNGVTVFVDYAHSSDGVEKVLTTLADVTEGQLAILWGAGGDRTPTKRPAVGEMMARYADYAIVTTDNPRSERPEDIARDVEKGVLAGGGASRYEVVLDRGEAIYRALDRAKPGDVVVVAGKGPERTIEFATHCVPFSDSETVLSWAAERAVEVVRP